MRGTPETDAMCASDDYFGKGEKTMVPAEFARDLERRLNMTYENMIHNLQVVNVTNRRLQEKNKVLLAALEQMLTIGQPEGLREMAQAAIARATGVSVGSERPEVEEK